MENGATRASERVKIFSLIYLLGAFNVLHFLNLNLNFFTIGTIFPTKKRLRNQEKMWVFFHVPVGKGDRGYT